MIGSLNVDLVANVQDLPRTGETVLARGSLAVLCGGKGANQALAAARLGARTAMVGRVGVDEHGQRLRQALQKDGVDCSAVLQTPGASSGVAMISVDAAGRNSIVVVQGANGSLVLVDVECPLANIVPRSIVVMQLEVPMATVVRAAELAKARGATVLLNPSPAQPLPQGLLAMVNVLVLNDAEATDISGVTIRSSDDAYRAAEALLALGPESVLLTMGAQGVVICTANGTCHAPAHRVAAVDTTGAGDTFVGGVATGLLEGMSLDEAVALGQSASALQVTRHGAQSAMPYRNEITLLQR